MKTHYLKQTILLLFLSVLMLHCSDRASENANSSDAEYVFHADSLEEIQFDSLKDFAKRIELIPLETGDDSFISRISELSISDQYIYVLSFGNNSIIKMFDRKGNYLNDVGGNGKGPGEYVYPRNLDWNPKQNAFYVTDMSQSKILKYDVAGKFIKEIRISDSIRSSHAMISLDNGDFLVKTSAYPGSEYKGFVALIDQNGNILRKYFEEEGIQTTLINGGNTFRRMNGEVYYTPVYSDAIFSFDQTKEEFSPYVQVISSFEKDLDFFEEVDREASDLRRNIDYSDQEEVQKNSMKSHEIRQKYKAVQSIKDFHETEDFIRFSFQYYGGTGGKFVFLDKESGEVKNQVLSVKRGLIFTNKVFGENFIAGNLMWVIGLELLENKELMIDLVKDTATEEEVEKIRSLTEEDNPVIAFFYFDE